MGKRFFNYRTKVISSRWERQDFTAALWRIYSGDPRWVPPYFPDLKDGLSEERNEHLKRLTPLLVYHEALIRPAGNQQIGLQNGEPFNLMADPISGDVPVAASVVLADPRRTDKAFYLGLLRSANDEESLERHLGSLREQLRKLGGRRMIGPVGLSPYINSGVLQDYWMEIPPLHTASNPPYFPEVIASQMKPLEMGRLFQLGAQTGTSSVRLPAARVVNFDPERLAADLLPLFNTTLPESKAGFAPPDKLETAYLLRQVLRWPSICWLVEITSEPVGFVILQPDLSPVLVRGRGGRALSGRLYIRWAASRPVQAGRVVFGGVHPRWRRQGIGTLLLHQAQETARQEGWEVLTAGPVPEGCDSFLFFQALRAEPRQSYGIYAQDL